MANNEEIDTEALQAQIDLSMSLMHGLVSSWINSGTKQRPTRDDRNSKLEDELKESMKRPPRLGVGASVAESSVASTREAARLKGQLVGKRKNRTDDDNSLPESSKKSRPDDDDEEEESRTGAIKKKTREDPFATKKRAEALVAKKLPFSTATSSITGTQKRTMPSEKNGTDDIPPDFKENRKATSPQLHNTSPRHDEQNGPKDSTLSSGTMANNQLAALPHSPSSTRKMTIHASLLNVPLLNLDGPVGGSSSGEEDEGHNQPQSPSKKKRKRRKRRKNKQNGSAQPGTGTP